MENICFPYRPVYAIQGSLNNCLADFYIDFLPNCLFAALIVIEIVLIKKTKEPPPDLILFFQAIQLVLSFTTLTVLLFGVDPEIVSIASVLSLTSTLVAQFALLSAYQYAFRPFLFCLTSIVSARLCLIVQLPRAVFLMALLVLNIEGNIYLRTLSAISLGLSVSFVFTVLLYNRASLPPRPPSPHNSYDRAGLFSKLLLLFTFKLLRLGAARPLENSDMEPPRAQETSEYQKEGLSPFIGRYLEKKGDKYALLKALIACYKPEILKIVLIGGIQTALNFTGPLFILMLESYLMGEGPAWQGYAIVSYILVSRVTQSILSTQSTLRTRLMNVQIRSGLSAVLYEKSLRISSAVIPSIFTYAQVVNLMSVDIERIVIGIPFQLQIVYVPFQFSIGMLLLFRTIRWQGSLASLAVMALIFFVNGLMTRGMNKVRRVIMHKKDNSMKACTELLSNIRVLKLYNWEKRMEARVKQARIEEMAKLVTYLKYRLGLSIFNLGAFYYIIISFLLALTVSGYYLSPGQIYAGISVIEIVNSTIKLTPDIINSFVNMMVSIQRMQDYLQSSDQSKYLVESPSQYAIGAKLASFAWSMPVQNSEGELAETRLILKDLTFTVRKGEFVAIVGRVGSGKSSLLHALIQNMQLVQTDESSSMFVNGTTAYVSQEAWIQNSTIKENILFGNPMDEERYRRVIAVSQLERDLQFLPGGDLAEIGEKGINLSGGQKTRIAIARAAYADTSILLMDDPLSAVDAHVGRALFQGCFVEFLAGRTRVLVTNNQQFLPRVDRIFVFSEGRIVETGTYQELVALNGHFKNDFIVEAPPALQQTPSEDIQKPATQNKTAVVKMIAEEDRAYGRVTFQTYRAYFAELGGLIFVISMCVLLVGLEADRMITDLYLANWTDQSPSEQSQKRAANFLIYSGGVALLLLLLTSRMAVMYSRGVHVSKTIFLKMIKALRRAPINKYFDVTPMGRILNRLSKDQASIETDLMYQVSGFLRIFFYLVMSFCICCYIVPYAIIGVPFTFYLAFKIRNFYTCSAREIARLISLNQSPLLHHFSETLRGVTTIRAFGYQDQFVSKHASLFNARVSVQFNSMAILGWLGLYLDLLTIAFLMFTTYLLVGTREVMTAGLAGVLLVYSNSLSSTIKDFILTTASLESSMVSYERALALTQIESEAPTKRFKDAELRNWPLQGKIEFRDFYMKYREDTPVVLNGMSAIVYPGEKVGIVGRTGSGKSSLCLAMFRIVEAYSGRILIDGIDISEIGLDLLRKNICVIPQDPTLFIGTVRDNIDPFNERTDEFLLMALKTVALFPGERPEDVLDKEVAETGSNFSMGQRQLLCIARAIVKDAKIMFLDEATASIDYKTDQVIQRVIRGRFADKTVLTIAHRINTVMDYDRVMLMDQGVIVEFGKPEDLMQQRGAFYQLFQKGTLQLQVGSKQ